MTDIVLFSGGAGSYRAAKVWRKLHPDADMRLFFTDTLYEDADTYRFLIAAAADVFGRKLNWSPRDVELPDYRVTDDVRIEDYCGNSEWRAALAELRERAMLAIPELIWHVEGRDPWEIFRDERFVGNSGVDPCSKMLKRRPLQQWLAAERDPANDRLIYGIGPDEAHRLDDGEGHGIRPRMAAKGWAVEAPLIVLNDMSSEELRAHRGVLTLAHGTLEELGLWTPSLYLLDYIHGNCGGFCVKGGFAHWQNRHRRQPDRFRYDAMMEAKCRAYLGTDSGTILTDRSGDDRRPLSLDAFGAKLAVTPEFDFEYVRGESGCGCMTEGY